MSNQGYCVARRGCYSPYLSYPSYYRYIGLDMSIQDEKGRMYVLRYSSKAPISLCDKLPKAMADKVWDGPSLTSFSAEELERRYEAAYVGGTEEGG